MQTLPPPLEGVVTLEEFKAYNIWEHKVRTDPEVVKLNEQIMELVGKLQELQPKLDAARMRARESDADMTDIGDRIREAFMKSRPMPGGAPAANAPREP